ncbi:MAG: division/cell wall cluster transcriptional repressor MraZ [Saprospiraceae bacterium]|nr:division/cell wall cluster transcriptional repressor MraZ [Saprospiraceae bacterium]
MYNLIGEYDVTMDYKGRIRLPSSLLEQLGGSGVRLIVNRGFEKCLVLYPEPVWMDMTKQVDRLNPFVERHRDFMRLFYRGASQAIPDATGRILLSRMLAAHAELTAEVVLFACKSQVEIWSRPNYLKLMERGAEHYASLAQDLLGHQDA